MKLRMVTKEQFKKGYLSIEGTPYNGTSILQYHQYRLYKNQGLNVIVHDPAACDCELCAEERSGKKS